MAHRVLTSGATCSGLSLGRCSPQAAGSSQTCSVRAMRSLESTGAEFLAGSLSGLSSSSSLMASAPSRQLLQSQWQHAKRTHRGGGGALAVRAAVFDQLSTNLEGVWKKLKGVEKLTADNIKEPLQDIRSALLEADVSLPVVRRFVKEVSERAVGQNVVSGVTPDQQLVKVVYDELVKLMGGQLVEVTYSKSGPTVILMAGLQGVGKTTACGKLANYLKKKGKSVLLVATDVYRPAAIEQLVKLGSQIEVLVFEMGDREAPAEIAKRGLQKAREEQLDVVIVDTAGRLQIDADMMNELKEIRRATNPTEVMLVVDAMTGQQAASLVAAFNLEVGITGAVLTKLDGDSRGGAALSVKEVSGKPIKFVGEGETMDSLEPFYPDRMASRILGMGDVVSLVEKAQDLMADEEAKIIQEKIRTAKFDFDDMLKQTQMVVKMGNMSGMMKMLPGANKVTPQQIYEAEKSMKMMEAMIQVMEPDERKDPELLAKSPSRRRRIAEASGYEPEQVSQLVQQLFTMRAKMKNIMGGIPGVGEDPLRGQKKAAPGTAKRKKQLAGRAPAMGFGAKKG